MADEAPLETKVGTLYDFLGVDRDASFQEIYVACSRKKEEIAETQVPRLEDRKRLKSAERILTDSTWRLVYDTDLTLARTRYERELGKARADAALERYNIEHAALDEQRAALKEKGERLERQYRELLLEIEHNSEKKQKWYVAREIATCGVAVLSVIAGGVLGFEFGPEDISSSVDTLEGIVKGGAVGLSLLVLRAIGENIYENYRERKFRARVEERLNSLRK